MGFGLAVFPDQPGGLKDCLDGGPEDSEGMKAVKVTLMSRRVTHLGSACALVVLFSAGSAIAAPDLRLVNAAAQQDWQAIRTLLRERVDVNTSRAGRGHGAVVGGPLGRS